MAMKKPKFSKQELEYIENELANFIDIDGMRSTEVTRGKGYSEKVGKELAELKLAALLINKAFSGIMPSQGSIFEKISRTLEKKKLSLDALAKKIKVTRQQLLTVLSGKKDADVGIFKKVLKTLGIDDAGGIAGRGTDPARIEATRGRDIYDWGGRDEKIKNYLKNLYHKSK